MDDGINPSTRLRVIPLAVSSHQVAELGARASVMHVAARRVPGHGKNPRPSHRHCAFCAAQARTLALSTVLTGLLGVGGFYILKEQGFFRTDQAELPSAKEAARMLRDPRVRACAWRVSLHAGMRDGDTDGRERGGHARKLGWW